MLRYFLILVCTFCYLASEAQKPLKLRKRDLRRDIEMTTSEGRMVLRLSDSTPLHRDNFIKLVKQHFYDSVLFHRVINKFMIQGGDVANKRPLKAGDSLKYRYTVPAEIRSTLFHKKGALAAARQGDNNNPLKASDGTQFYIVHGRTFSDGKLDTLQEKYLKGNKFSKERREYYKTTGGAPHLDQNYTVFGEVIEGLPVVDTIAAVPTTSDRPVKDVWIIKTRLIKRKR